MRPSTTSCVLSFVMHTCSATSSGTSFNEWRYATRSMNGAMTTAIILNSMLPPMEREISSAACARSGGPRLGNFEGAAIDRGDIEDFAGLAGDVTRDLRVPERVAVFHACVAGALVDPGVEGGRLAEIQPLHALRKFLFWASILQLL